MPKSKAPRPDPKKPLAEQAVMNVAEGETIAGAWATAPVPGTGVYKLAAKKTAAGVIEWVHFVHRADGRREVLMRGTAQDESQLKQVLDLANKHLARTFGEQVVLRTSLMELYAPDGRQAPEARH
jgi:hypothetical protein